MHVLLTGANGWMGSAISRELVDAGHTVTGLVRSPEAVAGVAAAGVTPLLGTLQDLDVLRRAAEGADGVIHTAFGLDLSKIGALADEDRRAIETFGDVFHGSARAIVVTGGVFLTPPGVVFTEDERPPVDPGFPRASEQTAFALAGRGIHASAVRLPRSVHGVGERHGFVPMLAAVAREKGVSAWIGDGENLWPAAHRLDAARVFRLAIEYGGRGEAFHAIAEQGVPFRLIAEAIGRQLGVPARSMTQDEAAAHFGPIALFVGGNGPASSAKTRALLGWTPERPGLIADIDQPAYYA